MQKDSKAECPQILSQTDAAQRAWGNYKRAVNTGFGKIVRRATYFKDAFRFNVLGHDIAISDEQLVKVLNELPPDRRDIILLAFFLGMIDREIAEQLDLVRQTAGQKPFRS